MNINWLKAYDHWMQISEKQRHMDEQIARMLSKVTLDEIYQYAEEILSSKKAEDGLSDAEIDAIRGDEIAKIMGKYMDSGDYLNSSSESFRKRLYAAFTGAVTLTSEERQKIRAEILRAYNKITTNTGYNPNRTGLKQVTGKSIAIGQYASNIAKNLTSSKKGPNIKIDSTMLQKTAKGYLHMMSGTASNPNVTNLSKSLNQQIAGAINEVEDLLVDNLVKSTDFIAELTWMLEGDSTTISRITTSVDRSVGKAPYDFMIEAKGYDQYGFSRSLKNGEFYFDSKRTGEGIGTTQYNAIVSDINVLLGLNGTPTIPQVDKALQKYNQNRSLENALLLEYLYQEYNSTPIYYLIDKSKKEMYSLDYLVQKNQIDLDPQGLNLINLYFNTNGVLVGELNYAKGRQK